MKKILGMMLSLALVAVPLKSLAEPILQRVERTGTIRAGAWKDAKPFGYVNEQGEWVGYSIDIMRVIQSQVETALDKPIKLELVEVVCISPPLSLPSWILHLTTSSRIVGVSC